MSDADSRRVLQCFKNIRGASNGYVRSTRGGCNLNRSSWPFRCRLSQARKQVVFGVGSPDADVVFVGEGPGAEEDRRGEPFVGKAGQLLNSMLRAIDLRREDVYIANIVKCRPPQNRDPQEDEAATCIPFLCFCYLCD